MSELCRIQFYSFNLPTHSSLLFFKINVRVCIGMHLHFQLNCIKFEALLCNLPVAVVKNCIRAPLMIAFLIPNALETWIERTV